MGELYGKLYLNKAVFKKKKNKWKKPWDFSWKQLSGGGK